MSSNYLHPCLLIVFVATCCQAKIVEMDIPFSEDSGSDGNLTFASYFGDHMVLQGAPRKAVIWGSAPKNMNGAKVTVSLDGKTYGTCTVTEESTWSLNIGPMPPGGPHTLTAKLEDGPSATLSDILFGDVWVCSGQSNMEFSMSQVFNSSQEIKEAEKYRHIRLFTVAHNTSSTPVDTLSVGGILLPWSLPTAESLAGKPFSHFSAVCWLYAKYLYPTLNKPLGMVQTTWGGTPVEAWSSPEALKKCGLEFEQEQLGLKQEQPVQREVQPEYVGSMSSQKEVQSEYTMFEDTPNEHSVLWNAMVNPLLKMTIYGAIWYQGEANEKRNMDKYNCTFPAMIDDWRKKFHASSDTDALFPFGFVQLAGNSPDYNKVVGCPDIRWHQTADYGYAPNHRQRQVFMAVAMDLPDFLSPYGSIHPRNKQTVAERLTKSGLAVAYGYKNVSFQGPRPVSVHIANEEPYNYTQVEVEYSIDIDQRWLDGFEICCAFTSPPVCVEGKSWWLPSATVQAYDRRNVTQTYASECSAENVVGLRYAWKESPCPVMKCAIYGQANGLPMAPFTYHQKEFIKMPRGHRKYVVNLK